jgi:hypothetical protein
MIRSPYFDRSGGRRERNCFLRGKNFFVGIAGILVIAYATTVLACFCSDDYFLRSSNPQNIMRGSITAETSDHDALVRLCESLPEHMLASPAFSNQANLFAAFSYMNTSIDDQVLLRTAKLDGFRPPGPPFARPEIRLQLYSVLRI